MITLLLHDLRWRIALLLPVAVILYALEPGFHQHEGLDMEAVALGPLGISAAVAHLASIAMIVLLAGFVSSDRLEGHTRIYFSHPTSPLAFYSVRWGLAYLISMVVAVLFLFLGQLIAWGEILGGGTGLIMPAVTALVYGGLIAFLSVVLRRGDAWTAFLLFAIPTFVPQVLTLGLSSAAPPLRQAVLLILPPIGALQQIWEGLLLESFAWGAVGFAAAYGALFLGAAALILNLREWP